MISNNAYGSLVFASETSTHYIFQLVYLDETTIDLLGEFIPSDARLDAILHLEGALSDLERALPREIPSGWQFPTNFIGGSFTTSVDSSFDYMSGFPFLSKIDYDAGRLLSAFLPMVLRPLDVYYVKSGETPTAIPASVSGCDKFSLPDGSTLFLPISSNWGFDWAWLATNQGSGYRTINITLALWLYSYADLPYESNHLMLHWDSVQASSVGTWLLSTSGRSIDWTSPSLPQWDETGDYPEPTLNHVAWRYFYNDNLYVKEAIYVPLPAYPVTVYPRKTPFTDTGTGTDAEDEFLVPRDIDTPFVDLAGLVFRQSPLPPATDIVLFGDGKELGCTAFPNKRLAILPLS
jgi:hypothetical protein